MELNQSAARVTRLRLLATVLEERAEFEQFMQSALKREDWASGLKVDWNWGSSTGGHAVARKVLSRVIRDAMPELLEQARQLIEHQVGQAERELRALEAETSDAS